MAPEKIPLEIVTDDVMTAVERAKAVAALTSMSLIEVEPEASGPGLADVHRLVQAVMQGRMSAEDRVAGAALAVRLVADAFPGTNPDPSDVRSWPACARLLPHALATIETGPQTGDASAPTARLANQCGLYLKARADYAAAEPLYRRALKIDEATYGPDHPTVAICLNNLAQLLQATGRLAEAEEPMRRALAIWEKALGPEHTQVATGLNNLAHLLQATGRLTEAEEPMRRALAIWEKALGPEHTQVATGLNNLASLLQATGRLQEAEEPMRRALAIDEAAYGTEHPTVAIRLNNLAQLLQATGRLGEAEAPMRRAVEILERSLGPDHPRTQLGRANLAALEAALRDASLAGAATAPLHGGSLPRRRWGLLLVLLLLLAIIALGTLAAVLDPKGWL